MFVGMNVMCVDHQHEVLSLDISPLYSMDMRSLPPTSVSSSLSSIMKSVWYIHCDCDTNGSLVVTDMAHEPTISTSTGVKSVLKVADTSRSKAIIPNDDESALSSTASQYGGHGHTHVMPSFPGTVHGGQFGVTIISPSVDGKNLTHHGAKGTRWYIMGGCDLASRVMSDRVCYYDSLLNQWIDTTPLPIRLVGAASCVYNDQIYVMVCTSYSFMNVGLFDNS
jgi:hypothetical protein